MVWVQQKALKMPEETPLTSQVMGSVTSWTAVTRRLEANMRLSVTWQTGGVNTGGIMPGSLVRTFVI